MINRLARPVIYVTFFCLFSWHLGGDGSPDSRIYHYYNGYAVSFDGPPVSLWRCHVESGP